jgi:hypothetical protein
MDYWSVRGLSRSTLPFPLPVLLLLRTRFQGQREERRVFQPLLVWLGCQPDQYLNQAIDPSERAEQNASLPTSCPILICIHLMFNEFCTR